MPDYAKIGLHLSDQSNAKENKSMPERPVKKREFVHATMLAEVYGLTRKMIEDLGEPDKRGPYLGHFSGELARLYHVDRVEAWVAANQEWLGRVNAARAQRAAAKKAAVQALRLAREAEQQERFRQMKEWVKTATIRLERPLPATLLEDARVAAEATRAGEMASSEAA